MLSGVGKSVEKLALMRRQQIDSLKIFNDKVSEVKEGVEYKVEFQADDNVFNVVVRLGNDFPLEKPVLKVEPAVSHPWVEKSDGEIVGAPGLLKFTVHSELGRVVQAIVREFELRPPRIIEESGKENATVSESGGIAPSEVDSPLFSLLESFSTSRLEKINKDEDALEDLVRELVTTSEGGKALDREITRIEESAEENLSNEETLSSLKAQIDRLSGELCGEFDTYQSLSSHYLRLCERFDPHRIRESLVSSITRVDEESERLAESFLDGDVDLDNFLTHYSQHRFLSHSRKFKSENLSQQLNKLKQSGF